MRNWKVLRPELAIPLTTWPAISATPEAIIDPVAKEIGEIEPQCTELGSRHFHHLDVQQHLLHAADGDIVDDLWVILLGHLDDAADLIGLIHMAGDEHARRYRADLERALGNSVARIMLSSRASPNTSTSTVCT